MPTHPALQYPPYALALAGSLVELASESHLDIVHVHYAVPHAASAYLARQVLGASAPRVVVTLHGSDVTQIGSDPSLRATTRFSVVEADGVTVPSTFLKAAIYDKLGVPADLDVEVIPNFVDTERFNPAPARDRSRFDALFASAGGDPEDRGSPVLFHVSSFRPVKRVVDLVEVLAAVRSHRKARLMLVGDGQDRQKLVQRARELGVSRSICLVGSNADFVDYLRHADAFLLPSESESFGVAALEALSCGVPVIAYRVGGLPDVVVRGVGRLVEPFDVAALSASTLEIVSDEELRASLGVAARVHAESRFRRDDAIDRYENHYRRILDAGRRENV